MPRGEKSSGGRDLKRLVSVWRISEHAANWVFRIGREKILDMPPSRLTGMMLVGRFGDYQRRVKSQSEISDCRVAARFLERIKCASEMLNAYEEGKRAADTSRCRATTHVQALEAGSDSDSDSAEGSLCRLFA